MALVLRNYRLFEYDLIYSALVKLSFVVDEGKYKMKGASKICNCEKYNQEDTFTEKIEKSYFRNLL